MKTILYIISLCALYVFLSVQIDVLAQSPAATRAYCDNNRNIAVQMTTQNLSTNLPIIVSQEVAKVSQSFVTNAYPVPVPVTNTVYVDTVISNQIIYQTTQTEVYATYSLVTNINVSIATNIYIEIATNILTNITYSTQYNTNVNTYIDTYIFTNIIENVNTYIDTYIATNITEIDQFIVDVSNETNFYFMVENGFLKLYYNGVAIWQEK